MKRTLTFFLAVACTAAAEEKSLMHMYNVSALTVKITNFRGRELGFGGLSDGSDMGAIGIGTSGGEEEGTAIPGEDLKLLISQNVAVGTWDSPPHSIEYYNGSLIVVHTPAVHELVKKFLEVLRSRAYKTVIIEADVVELAPGVLETAAGTVLTEEQLKAVDAAASDPARGRRLATLRACGLNTQRFNASARGQESHVRDYDIEIAQHAAIADPVIGIAETGYTLDVLPTVSLDESLILLTARFSCGESVAMREFQPGGTYLGTIEQPDQAAARTRTTLVIPAGKSAVLSSAGYSGTAKGWAQVVILRASIAGEASLPFPAAAKPVQCRLLDTRAILTRAPDFPGPRLGGIHVGEGSSGPTTTFVPPESETGVLVTPEQLETMIKQNVTAGAWLEREGEVAIALTGNQQLIVCHEAVVLAQVEALLGRLMASRSRIVSVDSWVVALDPTAWRERRTALSGEIAEAAWAELLDAAAKGNGARVVGRASAAGLNGTRFHTARGVMHSLVMDHDVEIAESASSLDPVGGVVAEGISLDVTPASVGDSGQIQLDLRPTVVIGGEPKEFLLKDKLGKVQGTSLADFGVRTQMLVDAGKPALVGIGSREDGGKSEVLLMFVKATIIDVK
ncbi:MAG: hypothetical protein AAB074_05860 [Planctomycetota bacterium]